MPLAPGTLLGPYEIKEPVGAGGPPSLAGDQEHGSFGGSPDIDHRTR